MLAQATSQEIQDSSNVSIVGEVNSDLSCDLDEANNVVAALQPFIQNAEDCSVRLSSMAETVGKAEDVAKAALSFAKNNEKITNVLNRVDSLFESLEPLIKLIPKVGRIMVSLVDSLDKVKKVVEQIGKKEEELKGMKDKLHRAKEAIDVLDTAAAGSALFGDVVKEGFARAIAASTNSECCGSNSIESVAAVVSTSSLAEFSDLFSACAATIVIPE